MAHFHYKMYSPEIWTCHNFLFQIQLWPLFSCFSPRLLLAYLGGSVIIIRSIWGSVGGRYIVSLAVGDILVILFCVPFTSTVYTVESWPFGLFVCKFSEFIKDVSIGVSVFTLTALSADRYFAIVDPMRKLQGRRATRITCIAIVGKFRRNPRKIRIEWKNLNISGIWILSIIFALPALNSFIWTIEDTSNNHTYDVCYPFPQEFGPTYPKVCKYRRNWSTPLEREANPHSGENHSAM